jgi:hypothetical protein
VIAAAVNPLLSGALRILADSVILEPVWAIHLALRSIGIHKYTKCTYFKDLISQVGIMSHEEITILKVHG